MRSRFTLTLIDTARANLDSLPEPDKDTRERGFVLFSMSELEAVHYWHREVEQDQIRQRERCADLQTFSSVRSDADLCRSKKRPTILRSASRRSAGGAGRDSSLTFAGAVSSGST